MKINLSQSQKDKILDSLNEDGKLSCVKALSLSKQLNIQTNLMCDVADELNIKIVECELGVFGSRPLGDKDDELYNKILSLCDENKKITCPILWEEAKKSSMKNVRSTVKQTDIFVTYCKLGCFKEGKKWMRK